MWNLKMKNRQCPHEWKIVEEGADYIVSMCILCGLEEFREFSPSKSQQCSHAFDIVSRCCDGKIMLRCAKCGLKAQTTEVDIISE